MKTRSSFWTRLGLFAVMAVLPFMGMNAGTTAVGSPQTSDPTVAARVNVSYGYYPNQYYYYYPYDYSYYYYPSGYYDSYYYSYPGYYNSYYSYPSYGGFYINYSSGHGGHHHHWR